MADADDGAIGGTGGRLFGFQRGMGLRRAGAKTQRSGAKDCGAKRANDVLLHDVSRLMC